MHLSFGRKKSLHFIVRWLEFYAGNRLGISALLYRGWTEKCLPCGVHPNQFESNQEHVLRNTLNRQSVPFSVALRDRYPDKTLEDITKELHDISGGHPETLFRCLDSSDPLAGAPQGSCGRLGIK